MQIPYTPTRTVYMMTLFAVYDPTEIPNWTPFWSHWIQRNWRIFLCPQDFYWDWKRNDGRKIRIGESSNYWLAANHWQWKANRRIMKKKGGGIGGLFLVPTYHTNSTSSCFLVLYCWDSVGNTTSTILTLKEGLIVFWRLLK